MKFYIASSFQNRDLVRVATFLFSQNDFIQAYDWTMNEKAATFEELRYIGEEAKQGIMDADFVVMILPAGKGSHLELGMAMALNKRIYLYSPDEDIYHMDKTITYYFLPELRPFVGQLADFISFVIKCENNNVVLH
ncbi:nucleoside 2-deoxyribosyltransferase [Bacillus benzoevorans]|uniref:Nucleoside 2-deoxyribosyltransferase n=1 Tax=Bacillus benzoevorans TaxID=1456 RepID=A0A7X0HNY7_9BACI|nr:nucleoside 2-deoxyribosyltransferase [Bacillus benzoevorans]MBB6444189.1 nucleoside 2-deoxyribosyltransferase [Bacillus benzoevorans]